MLRIVFLIFEYLFMVLNKTIIWYRTNNIFEHKNSLYEN